MRLLVSINTDFLKILILHVHLSSQDLQARLRQLRSSLQEPTAEAQRGIPFASVSTPDISKINSPKVDAIWNKENQTNLSKECRATGCSLSSRSVRQSGIHTSTPLTNIQCQKEQRRSNIDDSGLGGFTGQSFGIGRHDIPHKPLPPSPFLCPSNSPLHIHKQHSSTSANTKYFLNQQTPIFYSSNSAFTPVRQKPTRVEAVWRPYLDWRLRFYQYCCFIISVIGISSFKRLFHSQSDSYFSRQMYIHICINIFCRLMQIRVFFGWIVTWLSWNDWRSRSSS